MTIEPGAAVPAVAFTVVMAVLGTLLAGDSLRSWFPRLARPSFQIPTPVFAGVGAIGYVFDVVVLYRLLTIVDDGPGKGICLVAMVVTMAYNELWNGALFRLRSPFAGFLLLVAFLAPLSILEAGLLLVEPVSAALIGIYIGWVVLYDVPWTYRLWRLNPGQSARVSPESGDAP
jgi:tryptophan-rich sensory protein